MRMAIIDIGSNAIRGVVYEDNSLGAPEIFNEKFRSDILHLLTLEDLYVKHSTYLSLSYLRHIFNQLSVSNISCVATAVLRDHPRAEEFKKIVYQKFGIEINILSGDKEAYLTAVGLIAGIQDASGIAADLGGGSLELALVNNKNVCNLKSLPLGTRIIRHDQSIDLSTLAALIKREFSDFTYPNLYLIGGAFRMIGRIYMDFSHYPLKNLHHLEIEKKEFIAYLDMLPTFYKFSSTYEVRKIDCNATIVIKAMLETFSPNKVIISNYGLKEGVRFTSLSESERAKNIVYERINNLVKSRKSKSCNFSQYHKIISDLLFHSDSTTLIVLDCAIMLSQFNKNIDKTLRANFAVEFVLSSDIPFSHRQRIMLSYALAFTYNGRGDMYISRLAKRVLNKYDYCNSQIIGSFIAIARKIDGPEFDFPSFEFKSKNKYIEIVTNQMLPYQTFEKVCNHLKDIAFAQKMVSN